MTETDRVKRKRKIYCIISLCGLLILTILFSQFSLASSATMSDAQIKQRVTTALNNELKLLARQRGWSNYHSHFEFWIPSSASYLPRCQQPLNISSRDNQTLPVGNLKRLVTCPDVAKGWHLNVTVKAELTLPVIVSATTLNRGDHMTPALVKTETRTLQHRSDFYTKASQVTGQIVQRRIRAGQVIDPDAISFPPLVHKGNEVVIVAQKGELSASTKGIALQDGFKGQQIEVENSRSHKVIHAVVSGINQVKTQF